MYLLCMHVTPRLQPWRARDHDKPFPSNHEFTIHKTEAFCPQRQCVTDLRLILIHYYVTRTMCAQETDTVPSVGWVLLIPILSHTLSNTNSIIHTSEVASRTGRLQFSIIHLVALHCDFQNPLYSISISIKTLLRALFHHLLSQLCSLRSH